MQYDKMIFLSKESEEEWNDTPDSIRNTVIHILKQNVYEAQCKIQKEYEKEVEIEINTAKNILEKHGYQVMKMKEYTSRCF